MILLFWKYEFEDGPWVDTSYDDEYTGGHNPESTTSYQSTGIGYSHSLVTPRVLYDPSEDT